MNEPIDLDAFSVYLDSLQTSICEAFEKEETGAQRFGEDIWQKGSDEGGGRSCVLRGGEVFEQAGISVSRVRGDRLPAPASARRPELAGRSYEALGISGVAHPRNPYVPTSHFNVRLLVARKRGAGDVWWFGGGFDLTPYYGFVEDAEHWHRTARDACHGFGEEVYPRFKKWCDEYFYLPHRREPRGIGGIFFDDLYDWGFARCSAFARRVGDHYLPAYRPVVARRKSTPFGERERRFQLYRRGRYVEFNLVYDRGTQFGLQSGGRAESILMSLPPEARWEYGFAPEVGSAEAELYERFLVPREWIEGPRG